MNTFANKTQENKSQFVQITDQKTKQGKASFHFSDNRSELVAQRKLKAMANVHAAQRQVIQMVKYVQIPTGQVKEVEDDYELGWGQKFVGKPAAVQQQPAVNQPQGSVPQVPKVQSQVPKVQSQVLTTTPVVTKQTPIERGYPLGFESLEQFRNLTRPIAQKNRDATIIVTGSSVTGRSGDGKREFRHNKTPKVSGDKKSGPSDIDLGIVKPGSVGKGEVSHTGFPLVETGLSELERSYASSVEKSTGHPSGIKFFNRMPRGRSKSRERERIVREHTPEGQRTEVKEKEDVLV